MAKVPKVKRRDPSHNSRAARREEPAPKTLARSPANDGDNKPWLYHASHAGVSRKAKIKQLTRHQKLRQQRGLERADANSNKLEKKVADSNAREKKIKARRAGWDEVNNTLADSEPRKPRTTPVQLMQIEEDTPADKMKDGFEVKETTSGRDGDEPPHGQSPMNIRGEFTEGGGKKEEQDDIV